MAKNTSAQETTADEDRAAYLAFLMGHIDRMGLISLSMHECEKLSGAELYLCAARVEYEIAARERLGRSEAPSRGVSCYACR